MEYLLVGKIVNTHALKGEVRIISDFQYKDKIFNTDLFLYIGDIKEKLVIETYRRHKNFDMIKFKEYNDLLEVQKYKGQNVYINREEIKLNGQILDIDLIGYEVYFKNELLGNLDEIINNNNYKIFCINKYLIPYNDNFIEKIDIENKKIFLKNIEGMI